MIEEEERDKNNTLGERKKGGNIKSRKGVTASLFSRSKYANGTTVNRQEKRRERKKVREREGSLFITAVHFVPRVKIIRRSDGAPAVLSMEFRFLGENV